GAGGGIFMAMSTPEPVAQAPVVTPEPPPVPTPPPVAEVPEPPPAAPVVEEFLIAITSDPAGAAVWRGNELIGTTPLTLPRPTDERLDLQLRLDGYDDKDFAISSLTRAESINFTLDRTRTTSGRRSSSSSGTSGTSASGASEPPPAMTSMRPSGSEVLDPWAN
ncbi:MAG: hypothetical protein KC668_19650, partial [Myxococcales bacterium]|nr:hypothetical protein [Myxococcales bacterium]